MSDLKFTTAEEFVADQKGIPTKDDLLEQLSKEILVVSFTKLNGDKRVMTCTLREDIKPAATKKDPLSQEKVRKVSDKTITAWDVNAKGWRAFRYDRVEKVEQADGK